MISIGIRLAYPGLTAAEEERLAEHIRRVLQPHLVMHCGCFVRDQVAGQDGDFLRTSRLNVVTQIDVLPGVGISDPVLLPR